MVFFLGTLAAFWQVLANASPESRLISHKKSQIIREDINILLTFNLTYRLTYLIIKTVIASIESICRIEQKPEVVNSTYSLKRCTNLCDITQKWEEDARSPSSFLLVVPVTGFLIYQFSDLVQVRTYRILTGLPKD